MESEGNADMRGVKRAGDVFRVHCWTEMLSIFNFKVCFFFFLSGVFGGSSPSEIFYSQISPIAPSASIRFAEVPRLDSRWISHSAH